MKKIKLFTKKSLQNLDKKLKKIDENNPSQSDINFINPFNDIYDSIFYKNNKLDISLFKNNDILKNKNKIKSKSSIINKKKKYTNFYLKNEFLNKIIRNEIDLNKKKNLKKWKLLKKNKSIKYQKIILSNIKKEVNYSNLSNYKIKKKSLSNNNLKRKKLTFINNTNKNVNKKFSKLVKKYTVYLKYNQLSNLNLENYNDYFNNDLVIKKRIFLIEPYTNFVYKKEKPLLLPYNFNKWLFYSNNNKHFLDKFLKYFDEIKFDKKKNISHFKKKDEYSIKNSELHIEKYFNTIKKYYYRSIWLDNINNLLNCENLENVDYIGYYDKIPKNYFKKYSLIKKNSKKLFYKVKIDIIYNYNEFKY